MLSHYRPDKFSIYVSDLDQSLNFYRNVLGFEQLWHNPDAGNAGVKAGNNILIFQQNAERVSPGGFRPHITVDDLEALQQKLTAAGIANTGIQDFDSFTHISFTDPDGQAIGLLCPKPDYQPRMEAYLGHPLFAQEAS